MEDDIKNATSCQYVKDKNGKLTICGNKRQKVLPFCKMHCPVIKSSNEIRTKQKEMRAKLSPRSGPISESQEEEEEEQEEEEPEYDQADSTASTEDIPDIPKLAPVSSLKTKRMLDAIDRMPIAKSDDEEDKKKKTKAKKAKKSSKKATAGACGNDDESEALSSVSETKPATQTGLPPMAQKALIAGSLMFVNIAEVWLSKTVIDIEGTTNMLSQMPEFDQALCEIFEDMMPVEMMEGLETPYSRLMMCFVGAVSSARRLKTNGVDPKTFGQPPALTPTPGSATQERTPAVNTEQKKDIPAPSVDTEDWQPLVPGQSREYK